MTVWRGVATLLALSSNADLGSAGNTQKACMFFSPPPEIAAFGHAERYDCPFDLALVKLVNAAMKRDKIGPLIPTATGQVTETATLHTSSNGNGAVRFYLFHYRANGVPKVAMFNDAQDVDVVDDPADKHQDRLNQE